LGLFPELVAVDIGFRKFFEDLGRLFAESQ
jgi:hypothetical protein